MTTNTDKMELKEDKCPDCPDGHVWVQFLNRQQDKPYIRCYHCGIMQQRPSVKGEEWRSRFAIELEEWVPLSDVAKLTFYDNVISILAKHAPDVSELEKTIEAFKAASMLNDSTGDPDGITPDMVEKEVTGLRTRISRLEALVEERDGELAENKRFYADLSRWLEIDGDTAYFDAIRDLKQDLKDSQEGLREISVMAVSQSIGSMEAVESLLKRIHKCAKDALSEPQGAGGGKE